jgi:HAD superfamily hydrolase (TIGR01509 family)
MTTVGRFRHTNSLLIIVSTGMSQINAVIFDIDGTLLISNEAHAQAYIEAASMLGINADFTQIRSLIGKGGDKLIPEAFGFEQDSTLGKELNELKGKIFKTRYLPGLQPAPGTRPLLSRLHVGGVRLAVATSGDKASADALLERAGVKDLIDDMATADDVDASKPEPDVVHAALRKLDFPVSRIVMVGDTPYDVQAAQNAGVQIIAVRCGGWGDGQLQRAVAIYDDPAEILAHYKETFRPDSS